MTTRVWVALIACGIIGFGIGMAIRSCIDKTTFRTFYWEKPPLIVNCYGPDFSEVQMIRAISYWAVRGETVEGYLHSPPSQLCSDGYTRGMIKLFKDTDGSLSSDTLASTDRMAALSKMIAATIVYRPGSDKLDLLNEHELGHALGFNHVLYEGHVMYPIWDRMGDGFWVP